MTDERFRFLNHIIGCPFVEEEAVELVRYDSFEATDGVSLGKVLVVPQVPPWMSGFYPDVVESSEAGGPAMDEYGLEWFERIVYLEEGKLEKMDVLARERVAGLQEANILLQSPCSDGCAKTAPLVKIHSLRAKPEDQCPDRYHALITAYQPNDSTMTHVKSIGIYPVGPDLASSLRSFVETPRHKGLKALDSRESLRRRHLRAMKREAERR